MATDSLHPGAAEMFSPELARQCRHPLLPPATRSPQRCKPPNQQPNSYHKAQTLELSKLRLLQPQPPHPTCLSHKEDQSHAQNEFVARSGLRLTPAASNPWPLSAPRGSGTTR